jgi:hypothetical protein
MQFWLGQNFTYFYIHNFGEELIVPNPTVLDRRITSLSTSKKCFMVNRLTKEGDLKSFKMASTVLG